MEQTAAVHLSLLRAAAGGDDAEEVARPCRFVAGKSGTPLSQAMTLLGLAAGRSLQPPSPANLGVRTRAVASKLSYQPPMEACGDRRLPRPC